MINGFSEIFQIILENSHVVYCRFSDKCNL